MAQSTCEYDQILTCEMDCSCSGCTPPSPPSGCPCIIDDSVPYNPATYFDLKRVLCKLNAEASARMSADAVISGWCDGEFVKDEFTDYMDVDIHKEIRGGYSDDDILLIGTNGDGLHYMLTGYSVPSKCQCPGGQDEFDKCQFRNIIRGNGCYVVTNRDATKRTNVYSSEDGITWNKKDHTLLHVDTNGNVCYSDLTHKYYHVTSSSEYPDLGLSGNCVEVSDDLENWSVLMVDEDVPLASSHSYCSVICAGKYLYVTTVGNDSKPGWYTVVDLDDNTVHKEGDDIFHGYTPTAGWMRWVDGNRVYIGMAYKDIEFSDRIITTDNGFDTYEEYAINPGNKLGLVFPSQYYRTLIIRSMTKYKDVYFIGTYEAASPHILMSHDLRNWHVVSTTVQGIGVDLLCPFNGLMYVGYSGDMSEATGKALMADVRYTYHTERLVTKGILQDLENGGGGGSLSKVDKITVPYNDKIVRAKVNEIIVTLGGSLGLIPDDFTDEDIKDKVNEIISKYS